MTSRRGAQRRVNRGTTVVVTRNQKAEGKGMEENGAEYGDRTRDIQLGKLALYQLS